MKLTYIGGPTALLEIGGIRLLTDPTFDPPGVSTALAGELDRASCWNRTR